ncbi:MAG: hypothetical protein ACE5ES_05915 [Candidatus Nanoarchaeia archaeon]
MRRQKMQEHIVNEFDMLVDEIADELEVEIPYYPEVYWVGRNLEFEKLFIPENHRDEINELKKDRDSFFIPHINIFCIGRDDPIHLAEEASHFVHLVNSRLSHYDKNSVDLFATYVLTEMFGYFGSKLIHPDRRNCFRKHKSMLPPNLKNLNSLGKTLRRIASLRGEIEYECEIYKQAHDLGEKLFQAYISKTIKKREIKNLLKRNFKKTGEATATFLGLKYNTLNFK